MAMGSHWVGIIICLRPACSHSDSYPSLAAEMSAMELESTSRTNCRRRKGVAEMLLVGVYRVCTGSLTSQHFGMRIYANYKRRSFVKGHRHAGDHRSVGMRVVVREDRVVSPQRTLSRVGPAETRLTSMRQVRKALPRCTCSKTLVQNASAHEFAVRPKHHGINFYGAQILHLDTSTHAETHGDLTLVRGVPLCDAHLICNYSGLLVTGRRSSVRLC